ncbi:hypothetical protein ZIOFF_007061 [Zingiber officinale]|uniref:Uncharacterized protein n=1 Tax=Zingiber officinale TaxID=94328 RepID=A0A8J5I0L6_ZINOF|nr:hypothetical protein ZIOFF_007061 [Zingiber officinale]
MDSSHQQQWHHQQGWVAAASPPTTATISHGYHQPTTLEEAHSLWIGDLQYLVDENYLHSCFSHTGEQLEYEIQEEHLSKDDAKQQFFRILRTPHGNSVFFSVWKIDDPIVGRLIWIPQLDTHMHKPFQKVIASKDGSSSMSWDSLIEGVVRGEAKRWDELVAAYHNYSSKNGLRVVASEAGKEDIVEEEKKVTASQLNEAILREDYGEAAKLKLAIIGATKKDIVGARATEEERYSDAAFILIMLGQDWSVYWN